MDHDDPHRESSSTGHLDAVAHLASLVEGTPGLDLALAQEEVRVRVTDGMRRARQLRGLNQAQVAALMGISQGRVSRLESVHQDRRLDSLVAHLHAIGAELMMVFKVGDNLIPVVQPEGTRTVLEIDRVPPVHEDAATGTSVEPAASGE